MKQVNKFPISALLGLGHLLFISSLFWSDSINTGTLQTFVGAPLWELPYPSKSLTRPITYALGLLSSLCIVWSFFSTLVWRLRTSLILILSVEIYFVALDLKLANRYWLCLALGTFIFCILGERWARMAFWLWPASGPSGYLTLLTLPLIRKRYRPLLLLLLALLWYQSHQLASVRGLVISVGMAWLLFGGEATDFEESNAMIIGCALSVLLVATFWSHDLSPLRVSLEFKHEYKKYQIDILREGREVEIFIDGVTQPGPWYIDNDLLLNPYFFRSVPERLNSQLVYESYGRELAKRHGAEDFRVQFRPWSRGRLGQGAY